MGSTWPLRAIWALRGPSKRCTSMTPRAGARGPQLIRVAQYSRFPMNPDPIHGFPNSPYVNHPRKFD